jgi:hypothetical protein
LPHLDFADFWTLETILPGGKALSDGLPSIGLNLQFLLAASPDGLAAEFQQQYSR